MKILKVGFFLKIFENFESRKFLKILKVGNFWKFLKVGVFGNFLKNCNSMKVFKQNLIQWKFKKELMPGNSFFLLDLLDVQFTIKLYEQCCWSTLGSTEASDTSWCHPSKMQGRNVTQYYNCLPVDLIADLNSSVNDAVNNLFIQCWHHNNYLLCHTWEVKVNI